MRGAVILLLAAGLRAQGPMAYQEMDRRVRQSIASFTGAVSLFAKNLDSGAAYGIRADERIRTASTIKLPILVAVFAAVERGAAKWTDEMVLHNTGKVSGSGVLQELSDGVRLPLSDVVKLMIVVSDNTATNMVLDRFGADTVNAEMDRLGLKQTRSLRKVLGDAGDLKTEPTGFSAAGRLSEYRKFGLGVSTPREMVLLLEKIERREVVSAAASTEMVEILKRQQYKDGIGRHLDAPVASKSGALDHLRSDVGIAYTPGGRIAIAITVDDMPKVDYSPDNAGNVLISALADSLVRGLAKPGAQK